MELAVVAPGQIPLVPKRDVPRDNVLTCFWVHSYTAVPDSGSYCLKPKLKKKLYSYLKRLLGDGSCSYLHAKDHEQYTLLVMCCTSYSVYIPP